MAAKVESGEKKFETTAIRYITEGGKAKVSEIRVGGTKTTVLSE